MFAYQKRIKTEKRQNNHLLCLLMDLCHNILKNDINPVYLKNLSNY